MYYTFTLNYQLSEFDCDVDGLVHRLSKTCFDHALIRIGRERRLTLSFSCPVAETLASMTATVVHLESTVPSAKFLSCTRRDGAHLF
ncbi:hypothetical protein [Cupriavidus pampae]|uniref:Uncharacterized protein n=1 Tax=Cupriavidus pampae TaxID=659251 RepID=A0ABM8XJW9_9BURK|nr:hypothetical protein [Cupriavidus pampae]CAG9180502.1 hypothetical protein LMG32289_04636 [Cupriavidus pampae]